jgi:hypothetical protein
MMCSQSESDAIESVTLSVMKLYKSSSMAKENNMFGAV